MPRERGLGAGVCCCPAGPRGKRGRAGKGLAGPSGQKQAWRVLVCLFFYFYFIPNPFETHLIFFKSF